MEKTLSMPEPKKITLDSPIMESKRQSVDLTFKFNILYSEKFDHEKFNPKISLLIDYDKQISDDGAIVMSLKDMKYEFKQVTLEGSVCHYEVEVKLPYYFCAYYWKVVFNDSVREVESSVFSLYTDFDYENLLAVVYDPSFSNTVLFDGKNWHGDQVVDSFVKRYCELTKMEMKTVRGRVLRASMRNLGYNYLTFNEVMDLAQDKPVIISTSGIKSYNDVYLPRYRDGLTKKIDNQIFMPLGNNGTSIELNYITFGNFFEIVCCGAGDAENENNTAFGAGLEFWDTDYENETIDGDRDTSSYSNGVIAATLLYIKECRKAEHGSCTWWQARFSAWITGHVWDKYDGFGKINVNEAIHYEGEIPPKLLHLDAIGMVGDDDDLSNMELHDTLDINISGFKTTIIRVKTGWIYVFVDYGNQMKFVPDVNQKMPDFF